MGFEKDQAKAVKKVAESGGEIEAEGVKASDRIAETPLPKPKMKDWEKSVKKIVGRAEGPLKKNILRMTKLDEKFNKGTRRQVKEYEKDFAKDVATADEHLVDRLVALDRSVVDLCRRSWPSAVDVGP